MVDICLANSDPVQPQLLERYQAEDAAPLVVDRARIEGMGAKLVELPLASGSGDFARHDPDLLAEGIMDIYRQRAIRIFTGEHRYIIEE